MAGLNTFMYDPRLVQPMREELTRIGFEELRTATAVDAALGSNPEPTLVVVNSVCGCAARNARPAVALAIQHPKRPSRLLTVFAGQDAEATGRARGYFSSDGALEGREPRLHAGTQEHRRTARGGHRGRFGGSV
jgi:putative YphP/YqiW family bacilliredoxin